jgi:hypothetical protein
MFSVLQGFLAGSKRGFCTVGQPPGTPKDGTRRNWKREFELLASTEVATIRSRNSRCSHVAFRCLLMALFVSEGHGPPSDRHASLAGKAPEESASGTEKALDLGIQSSTKEASLLLGRICASRGIRCKGYFPASQRGGQASASYFCGLLLPSMQSFAELTPSLSRTVTRPAFGHSDRSRSLSGRQFWRALLHQLQAPRQQ